MREDLARSGIDEVSTRTHRMVPLTAAETYALTNSFQAAAYRIPYPTSPDFYRLRFLESVTNGKKPVRYWQPNGSPPAAYFSPAAPTAWNKASGDHRVEVYITEGEKKAIAGCLAGYQVLGLGGVWSWKADRWNLDLLPELEDMDWVGRTVCIIFDSDIIEKKEVQQAFAFLARTLARRGAQVEQALLPSDTKGLDDYLVAGRDLSKLERHGVFDHLEQLNEDFVYVSSEQKVLRLADLATGNLDRMCPRSEAAGHFALHQQAEHFKEWGFWTGRNEAGGFTYRPGFAQQSAEFPGLLNIWVPPNVAPKKGSVQPWRKFMQYLLSSEPTGFDYVRWWLAMTVVRPEVKVRTSVVLWSEAQGTGKTLCFELMRDLVGKQNYGVPSLSAVASNFNAWVEGKKLLVLNEAYDSADRNISNALKDIQTSDHIEINAKYRSPYHIRNAVHLAVTSNKPTPVYITKADRRHYVVRTPDQRLTPTQYEELLAWWKRSGASAVLWHLQNEVDFDQFNPASEPPVTEAKRQMVEANYTEAERVLVGRQWESDWIKKCDLVEIRQLMPYLHAVNPRVSETQVRNSLHRLGARHEKIKIRKDYMYLWAVRNFEEWREATTSEMRTHATAHNPLASKPSAIRKRIRARK